MGVAMLKKLLDGIYRFGDWLQSPLLLVIRLYWGYKFMQSGYGKFQHIPDVIGFFQSIGIPFASLNAYMAASCELLFGGLFLLGLFARIASIPLFIVMATAYVTAHTESLITLFTKLDPSSFFEQAPFLFAYAALLVFAFGPGKLSLDHLISKRR